MNLHRSDKLPDWEKVDPEKHNSWQKIAKKTNGLITPGNLVTVAGAAFVVSGAKDINDKKDKKGLAKLTIGRIADLADGYVADKTGTKSSKGEALDAFVDSAEMIAFLPLMVKKEYLPLRTGIIYGLHKAINAGATAIAKRDDLELHTSWAGKRAEAARNTTIGLYGLAKMVEDSQKEYKVISKVLDVGAKASEITSIALGTIASAQYILDITKQKLANTDLNK
jgi:phosphatidylglycerophosphate synthase